MDNTAPVLITPECHTPGCHNDGDQFTMIKCRLCGHWFCGSHLDPAQTLQLSPQAPELSIYTGLCVDCSTRERQRHTANDTGWLN